MYQKNSLGDEIYPQSVGYETYLLNSEKMPVMAKRRNSKGILTPYFALDMYGFPICPTLPNDMSYLELDIPYPKKDGRELYPKLGSNEIYIGLNGICKYAKDENMNEYFATKHKNKLYYAFNSDGIEFPAKNAQHEPIYIMQDNGLIQYPYNKTKDLVLFPLDSNGQETYIEINNKQFFAPGPIYLKNKMKDEVLPLNNSIPYYGFDNSENEYYPILHNDSEFYLQLNNRKIYAKRKNKNEFYAKNADSVAFLADDSNIPYYATNHQNVEIYPHDPTFDQFYRKIDNVERVAIDKSTGIGFYAKKGGEFYPKTFVD